MDDGEALKWITIGNQIRAARLHREMTQLDLAVITDTSRQTVQNDESGLKRITRTRLAGYCATFEWSLPKILDFLEGRVADELTIEAARTDYLAFVRAIRDLTHSTAERDRIFAPIVEVISARYGVEPERFTQKVW